jgi:hypothetical protein
MRIKLLQIKDSDEKLSLTVLDQSVEISDTDADGLLIEGVFQHIPAVDACSPFKSVWSG